MDNPILEIIEKQQQLDAAAWETFNAEFERRKPPPTQRGSWLIVGMSIGLVASLMLSGQLTIPAFMRVLSSAGNPYILSLAGGIAGFVSVDLVMFFSTYYLIDSYYRPKALNGEVNMQSLTHAFAVSGVFGFVVSVGSNIYFVLSAFELIQLDTAQGTAASLVIGLLLAFAPPIQATALGSILALLPLTKLIETQAYERSRDAAWRRYKGNRGLNLDVERIAQAYVERRLGTPNKTVSDSLGQSQQTVTLTKKAAIQYIKDNETKYEQIAKDVLEQNPTANQRTIAEAIAEAMTGDARGFKTVIRAYKELGKSL